MTCLKLDTLGRELTGICQWKECQPKASAGAAQNPAFVHLLCPRVWDLGDCRRDLIHTELHVRTVK